MSKINPNYGYWKKSSSSNNKFSVEPFAAFVFVIEMNGNEFTCKVSNLLSDESVPDFEITSIWNGASTWDNAQAVFGVQIGLPSSLQNSFLEFTNLEETSLNVSYGNPKTNLSLYPSLCFTKHPFLTSNANVLESLAQYNESNSSLLPAANFVNFIAVYSSKLTNASNPSSDNNWVGSFNLVFYAPNTSTKGTN